jgi:hypothetical protein
VGKDEGVIGALIIVAVIVLVLPPVYLMTGGILSAVVGWALRRNGEDTHEGSELIDLYC